MSSRVRVVWCQALLLGRAVGLYGRHSIHRTFDAGYDQEAALIDQTDAFLRLRRQFNLPIAKVRLEPRAAFEGKLCPKNSRQQQPSVGIQSDCRAHGGRMPHQAAAARSLTLLQSRRGFVHARIPNPAGPSFQ